jgi:hypothetical protein
LNLRRLYQELDTYKRERGTKRTAQALAIYKMLKAMGLTAGEQRLVVNLGQRKGGRGRMLSLRISLLIRGPWAIN